MLSSSVFSDVDMDISRSEVYEAIDRGYTSEIVITDANLEGHVSNVKGIALEMEINRELQAEGYESELFANTNHEGTDIIVNGHEYSIKSGSSIYETTQDIGEGYDVISTSEIASSTEAIDCGLSNEELTDVVTDVLLGM